MTIVPLHGYKHTFLGRLEPYGYFQGLSSVPGCYNKCDCPVMGLHL